MQDHTKVTVRDKFSTELPYPERDECRCGDWSEGSSESHTAHVQSATLHECIDAIDRLITEVVEDNEGSSSLDEHLGGLGDAITCLEQMCAGG